MTNCQERKRFDSKSDEFSFGLVFEVFCLMSGGDVQRLVGSMTFGAQENFEPQIEI